MSAICEGLLCRARMRPLLYFPICLSVLGRNCPVHLISTGQKESSFIYAISTSPSPYKYQVGCVADGPLRENDRPMADFEGVSGEGRVQKMRLQDGYYGYQIHLNSYYTNLYNGV